MKRKMLTKAEASAYGFDWPGTPLGAYGDERPRSAHVQVTRTASIERGYRGIFKIVQVGTERDQLQLYVSPTGKVRVFRDNKELKEISEAESKK